MKRYLSFAEKYDGNFNENRFSRVVASVTNNNSNSEEKLFVFFCHDISFKNESWVPLSCSGTKLIKSIGLRSLPPGYATNRNVFISCLESVRFSFTQYDKIAMRQQVVSRFTQQ